MKQSAGTILVVDDNHENISLLRRILIMQDYRVTVATGGISALNSVQTEKPDLILLDIGMPDVSGFDVCERLKADSSTRDIPILFLSAYADQADISKGFSLGGLDYITKPFHTEELLARVKTHLALSAMQQDMKGLITQRTAELERANAALSKSEDKYRSLFEKMNEGFGLYEVIVDEDEAPFDYRYLEINPVFESMTGLKNDDVIGRTVREVLPGIENDPADWIGRYGKVALTGDEISFEDYSQPLQKWFQIDCFSPRAGQFAVIFKDITESKQAEQEIRTSLKEKEILLRELYHRTKNNIQVIISMLRLRARKNDHPRVREIFREMENKMLSMALAHQKLYESRDLSHLNLKEYFDGLIHVLKKSLLTPTDRIDIQLEGDDIEVVLDTAIPCGIIVTELVTNSIKHAFPERREGRLAIKVRCVDEGEIVLEVCDNGVGVPHEFDIKRDGGLGMRTVIDLVEYQLDGDIRFKNDHGLCCTITISTEYYSQTIIDG